MITIVGGIIAILLGMFYSKMSAVQREKLEKILAEEIEILSKLEYDELESLVKKEPFKEFTKGRIRYTRTLEFNVDEFFDGKNSDKPYVLLEVKVSIKTPGEKILIYDYIKKKKFVSLKIYEKGYKADQDRMEF